jgi:hypothetical protein
VQKTSGAEGITRGDLPFTRDLHLSSPVLSRVKDLWREKWRDWNFNNFYENIKKGAKENARIQSKIG